MAKLVTVIIPCFNQGHFVSYAIESILAQTYLLYEIIVVNDGSSDDTVHVVEAYEDVLLINQPNQGVSKARNNGLKKSSGEYVIFLDADDCLLPGALALLVNFLETNPAFGYVSGHVEIIDGDGKITDRPPCEKPQGNHYKQLLLGNYIYSPGAVMYRASVFTTEPAFDFSSERAEDFELNLRIARKLPVGSIENIVLQYRQHDTNVTKNAFYMARCEMKVRRAEYKYVRSRKDLVGAWRRGNKVVYKYLGEHLLSKMTADGTSMHKLEFIKDLYRLARVSPYRLLKLLGRGVKRGIRF
jgi:glycosyltransferase involved in cell wall biosynthesis